MGTLRSLRAKLAGSGLELKSNYATGAAADTNITLTGIKVGDQIVASYELYPPNAAQAVLFKTNLLAETIIVADDTIQIETTVTTGQQIFVMWWTAK